MLIYAPSRQREKEKEKMAKKRVVRREIAVLRRGEEDQNKSNSSKFFGERKRLSGMRVRTLVTRTHTRTQAKKQNTSQPPQSKTENKAISLTHTSTPIHGNRKEVCEALRTHNYTHEIRQKARGEKKDKR